LNTKEKIRPDGRDSEEVRPLESIAGLLPRVHGSGLFTRRQTQALSTTTLGPLNEYQVIDGLGSEEKKRFIHHYNFPNFSVGETGRVGAPGRREIGHGADRKSTRLNSSHVSISYAVFCLKKKMIHSKKQHAKTI